jgi:hypothetical protein
MKSITFKLSNVHLHGSAFLIIYACESSSLLMNYIGKYRIVRKLRWTSMTTQ